MIARVLVVPRKKSSAPRRSLKPRLDDESWDSYQSLAGSGTLVELDTNVLTWLLRQDPRVQHAIAKGLDLLVPPVAAELALERLANPDTAGRIGPPGKGDGQRAAAKTTRKTGKKPKTDGK